ncbi:GNAT family N-acetyltransferase [Solirubrum puertoriconensis]|uniref:N-acetyltransferase domain-containing protein n=1 Tax=Solirubrum puertoriconensis TaxID=1751427 RepID=A0A9X0L5X2_SOLP1|nr:GNAT family N-acetyltransferase [Solirubrum puertoriconensis]KUG09157.1 hypothetical protein ASU33_20285 [Solirubrum puertoriconensis]
MLLIPGSPLSPASEHPLDNPIWHALRTGNQALTRGDESVLVFPRDVGAFAGLAEYTPANLGRLHELTPAGEVVILFTPAAIAPPAGWRVNLHRDLLQLVYPHAAAPVAPADHLVALGEADVPAMLALTALTKPGPFLSRTIDFGGYYGVKHGGELVAMAGQRLQPSPYTEVSAVCTHPDYLGRGYAGQLVCYQLVRILAQGRVPFLHLYEDNTPAYRLYLKLGFVRRGLLQVYVLEKLA